MATPGILHGLVRAISSVFGLVLPLAIAYRLVRLVTVIREEDTDASDGNGISRTVGEAVLAVFILLFAWILYLNVLRPFSASTPPFW